MTPTASPTSASLNALGAERVIDGLREDKLFGLLAQTFQALGDASRLQIVWSLSKGELSVGALAELMRMSQPAVSHHLRTLRNLSLVRTRKEGRTVFYALDDEHIDQLVQEGINHVEEWIPPSRLGESSRAGRRKRNRGRSEK